MPHIHIMNERDDITILGFWIYLMTDCVVFACLFAAYAVLHTNTFGGPSAKDLFDLPFVLNETLILLTSSFTAGLVMLSAQQKSRAHVLGWLAVTLLLGFAFLGLEMSEFSRFITSGASWHRSAFLSSFFVLVGTHGLHVLLGSIWMLVLMAQVAKKGLSGSTMRRLTCWSLFWHFLDIIWVCIFTLVYVMGIIQ